MSRLLACVSVDPANAVSQLHKLLSGEESDDANPSTLFASLSNNLDNDNIVQACLTDILPLFPMSAYVAESTMVQRQCALLCRNLSGNRDICWRLSATDGLVAFLQRLSQSSHVSIEIPASWSLVRLIAFSDKPMKVLESHFYATELQQLIESINKILQRDLSRESVLDSLRVLNLLQDVGAVCGDQSTCQALSKTFYHTSTPFVSNQTAELILRLVNNDQQTRAVMCAALKDQSETPNAGPHKASLCWDPVKKVVALAD